MEVLFLIIPISLVLVAIIAAALFWSVRSRQYDDLDRAAMEPLLEDDAPLADQRSHVEDEDSREEDCD